MSGLQQSFNIVTDEASGIKETAGISVSRTRSALGLKWMHHLVHVINNAIKYVFDKFQAHSDLCRVYFKVKRVRRIVKDAKQSCWYNFLLT